MKYFTIDELLKSEKAKQSGFTEQMQPPPEITYNLRLLIDNLLDPIREEYGRSIRGNSGYRGPRLNDLVKGSKTSDHMKGRAADLDAGSRIENKKIFEICKKLKFTQLINENDYSWIHVSYDPLNLKNQILAL